MRYCYFVGFEFLMVVTMRSTVFWVLRKVPNVSEEFIAFIFRVEK
jgi:hypothetical protein